MVTITDHNRIEGVMELMDRYPDDVFAGVETTTYFPEDGCKVHLLIYGFTRQQFAEINVLRNNIYKLSDYLRAQGLLHVVAHANSAVDDSRMNCEHLERLLVLFDYFEAVNGSYSVARNNSLQRILKRVMHDPDYFRGLCRKHSLEPMSDCSWQKGLLGGSDDHGGLYLGKTYTSLFNPDHLDVLSALMSKETCGQGWQCLGYWWPTTILAVGLKFFFSQINTLTFMVHLRPIM